MQDSRSFEGQNITEQMVALPGGQVFTRMWPGVNTAAAPILLLHDSLGSVELWRDFPAALCSATGRTVLAYDRPGYGRSEAQDTLPGDDIVEGEAEVVRALLAALGHAQLVACGHSIGGEMSVACGARLPDQCTAVIAIAAQSWLEEQTLAAIAAARAQFSDTEQFARLAKYHGNKAQWVLDAWVETWFRPSMRAWTIAPELPKLRSPLLIIHGDRDEFASLAQPRRMAALAGGPVQLEILSDCGHLPHREQPEVVLTVIRDFLRGLP